ncbi:MAG: 30S ribosomal protein S20 [bacterium]
MPITKSAKKALRQNNRRRERNSQQKTALKKLLKDIKELAANRDKTAKEKLPTVFKAIDKAAKNRLLSKNTASRRKSMVSRLLNKE